MSIGECVCGYKRTHSSNWSRHRKQCKVLSLIKPLQEENERLRAVNSQATATTTQCSAALEALEERMERRYSQLEGMMNRMQSQLEAIVPARQTTINNTTVHIHIYAFPETPLPKRKDVFELLLDPPNSLPAYFQLKHLSEARRRNVILETADSRTISVYQKDRASGVVKWNRYNRASVLDNLVNCCLEDLIKLDAHQNAGWKLWRRWCTAEGLIGYTSPEMSDAYETAKRDIEMRLVESIG
jgi:hypothetical protein